MVDGSVKLMELVDGRYVLRIFRTPDGGHWGSLSAGEGGTARQLQPAEVQHFYHRILGNIT